jgi:class 3 adenylate cyclase
MRPVLVHPPPLPEKPASGRRKLAAILHADVVGFSRLMGEDEAATHRTLGELPVPSTR